MALDSTKWQFTATRGIRYIGGAHGSAAANYVSVYELHRWLQDLADDATAAGDDLLDITKLNPSDKKFTTIIELLNGAFLDDAYATPASEFIYGGSIIQNDGGGEVIYDGISVVANRGVVVNVIQNNTVLSNKFWNNTPNGESFAGINPDPANGVAMRFMVKVKSAGSTIDNGALIFTTREWGKTFSEFRIPATGRGVNVVPLTYADDLNNTTASGTVATWTAITNVTAGFNLIDVNNDATDEEYYSEWNRDTYSINQFYERMKYLSRNSETATLYGIPGERFRGITHAVDIGTPAGGTFTEGGATPLAWGSGGTAGTKTFTITSHNFSTNNAANGANTFISYIDAAATGANIQFNTIQSSAQTLYVEARFGGTGPNYTDSIKPAKTTGALGSTGGSATISSVSDA